MLKKQGSVSERSEQLIEQLTQWINRRHLALPSLVLLDMAKPFSFIASQGLLLGQPLLSFVVQESLVSDYADLLAERANIDRLIARLEVMASRSDQGKGDD